MSGFSNILLVLSEIGGAGPPPSTAIRGAAADPVNGINTAISGDGGVLKFSVSPTTTAFTSETSGVTTELNSACYINPSIFNTGLGNPKNIIVGNAGVILTSDDAMQTWTSRTSGTSNNLYGCGPAQTALIACGASGTILTSPDGITWTSRTSGVSVTLRAVSYDFDNSIYDVVVGDNGTILTSPDHTTWTARTSGTSNNLYGAAAGSNNSPFATVVVGAGGFIASSADSITWTTRTSGTVNDLNAVYCYFNDSTTFVDSTCFVAVGNAGTILTSPDGTTWTSQTSGTSQNLFAVTNSGFDSNGSAPHATRKFWTVTGDNGTILVSTDAVTWSAPASSTTLPVFMHQSNNSTGPFTGGTGPYTTSVANGSGQGFYLGGGTFNSGASAGATPFPSGLLGNSINMIAYSSKGTATGPAAGVIILAVAGTVSQSLFTQFSFTDSNSVVETFTSASATFSTSAYPGFSVWYWTAVGTGSAASSPFTSADITFTI